MNKVHSIFSIALLFGTLVSCETLPDVNSPEADNYRCEILNKDSSVYDVEEVSDDEFRLIHRNEGFSLILNEKVKTITFTNLPSDDEDSPISLNKPFSYGVLEKDSCEYRGTNLSYGSSHISKFDFSAPVLKSWNREVKYYGKSYRFKDINQGPSKFLLNEIHGKKIKLNYRDVDWDVVTDLNQRAFEIWEELAQEYSNQELRDLYLHNKSIELLEFKNEVTVTLESTSFQSVFNARNIESYHPLFTQVLLDLFFKAYRTDPVHAALVERRLVHYNPMHNGFYQLVDRQKIYANIFSDYIDRKDKLNTEALENDGDEFAWRLSYVSYNAIAIIQTFSTTNCYEWGLFPEINRLYLQGILGTEQHDYAYFNHIVNSNMLACGNIRGENNGAHFLHSYYNIQNIEGINGVFDYFHSHISANPDIYTGTNNLKPKFKDIPHIYRTLKSGFVF